MPLGQFPRYCHFRKSFPKPWTTIKSLNLGIFPKVWEHCIVYNSCIANTGVAGKRSPSAETEGILLSVPGTRLNRHPEQKWHCSASVPVDEGVWVFPHETSLRAIRSRWVADIWCACINAPKLRCLPSCSCFKLRCTCIATCLWLLPRGWNPVCQVRRSRREQIQFEFTATAFPGSISGAVNHIIFVSTEPVIKCLRCTVQLGESSIQLKIAARCLRGNWLRPR